MRPAMKPTTSTPTILLIAVAAGLVGGAIGAALFPPQVVELPKSPETQPTDPSDQVAALEARVTKLESLMDRVAQDFVLLMDRQAIPAPSGDPVTGRLSASDMEALARQIATLEKLAATPGERSTRPSQPTDGPPEGNPAKGWHQDRILSTATAADKLRSWGALRRMGPDAWSDAVVQEMIQLGQTASDPATRADVWRQADARARHPAMRGALLVAMVQDPNPSVRGEAAETLECYCDDPQVVAALEQAAVQDKDPEVRENANKALRKWREDQRERK